MADYHLLARQEHRQDGGRSYTVNPACGLPGTSSAATSTTLEFIL
jgi:hypothetical protein